MLSSVIEAPAARGESRARHCLDFLLPGVDQFKRAVQLRACKRFKAALKAGRPAHISIKRHLDLTTGEVHDLALRLRRRELRPVEAVFHGIGYFEDSGTLYLSIGGPIIAQWQRLHDWFDAEGYPPRGFEGKTCHLSLFSKTKLREAELDELRAELDPLPPALRTPFVVRELLFYRQADQVVAERLALT